MYILDTNHLIALDNGGIIAKRLTRKIDAVSPNQEITTSIISYKEQIEGCFAAINRKNPTSEQLVRAFKRLKQLLRSYCEMEVLEFDTDAERIFRELRKLHRPKPGSNDLRIAAIALANEAIVVTQNVRDFEMIEGLSVEDWISL